MDLQAYPRTVSDLFSADKRYVVPRFQREYSWGEEELSEFWSDIVGSLKTVKGVVAPSNYFIGSIVLIGQDTSKEFQIVDGQQRLTTITIILSVLVDLLKAESMDDAMGLYKFIEGVDLSNKKFFKLVNENPKPFLQVAIQNFEKEAKAPNGSEEIALQAAFSYFKGVLSKGSLAQYFDPGKNRKASSGWFLQLLQRIRDQILAFKVISIYVPDQDYAYDIFETLNARGMDLSTIDLVKNEIFRALTDEHPADSVKIKWDQLRKNLISRDGKLRIDTFFRHFWISKFEFRTESKIFKSFKNRARFGEIDHAKFLDDLNEESDNYLKIASPMSADWTSGEAQEIFKSLRALELFRVTQPRSLLLALLSKFENGAINQQQLLQASKLLENFHFSFTAICSSRASGLESKYSSFGRTLRTLKKGEIKVLLEDLRGELAQKMPPLDIFSEGFCELEFSNKNTRNKRLIQYTFSRLEKALRPTRELEMSAISLEHVEAQKGAKAYFANIGNLLPLSAVLNQRADTKPLREKLKIYKESDLRLVQNFVKDVSKISEWNERTVSARASDLAKAAYKLCSIDSR